MISYQNPPADRGDSVPNAARLLRLPQVLQFLPISRSAWWAGVKDGRYPEPVRIGSRSVAWRFDDVQALIKSFDDPANKSVGRNFREAPDLKDRVAK